MNEKRFSELFPEVEERENGRKREEEKQREFFAHMKRQLKPKKEWKLPKEEELVKWKQNRWKKLTAYSATAAACLLLAVLLPNLPVLLKISDQDISRSGEKETSTADFSAPEQDMGEAAGNVSAEPQKGQQENLEEETEAKESGKKEDEKKENGKQKNKRKEGDVIVDDAAPTEEAKQGKNEKTGNDGKTGKEKNPLKDANAPKGTEGKESTVESANHQGEKNGDVLEEVIMEEPACGEEEPAVDETVQSGTGAAAAEYTTEADAADTAADMPADAVAPEPDESDEIEETMKETITADDCALPEESAEEDMAAESALETALTAWWQEEYGAMDTGNAETSENGQDMEAMPAIPAQEEGITKEEAEQGLLAYPYLCYCPSSGGQLWYGPAQEFRQNADGMDLLGTAYIFQLKTTLLSEENGNQQQKVYVYGNKEDLSELLVRFQAEGVDYYYVYEAVSG